MTVKIETYFLCQACGYKTTKWLGKCPDCNEWNSLVEEREAHSKRTRAFVPDNIEKPVLISEIEGNNRSRISTSIAELDRVLGGGIVPGSIVLVGGDPGIGKSTLLLQASYKISNSSSRSVLYITGEESSSQVKIRGERLGLDAGKLYILPENNLEAAMLQIEKLNPSFIIVDSIQTIYTNQIQSAPGTVSQIREVSSKLIYLAKKLNICIFLVGHVTKDGAIAGPRVLEHMVDTVLYFEGNNDHSFRILRSVKNRFGSTNEIGVFEMKKTGLIEVSNPSEVFISERLKGTPGSVILPIMEGTRPILIELQALVSKSANLGMPRRMSTGVDHNRVSLLLAVLEKRMGFNFQGEDVFINITGGIKTNEPAVDLGIVSAISSSYKDQSIDPYTVVIGEVGLSGELRSVANLENRINEASRLGFKRCIIPENKKLKGGDLGIDVIAASTVDRAIEETVMFN